MRTVWMRTVAGLMETRVTGCAVLGLWPKVTGCGLIPDGDVEWCRDASSEDVLSGFRRTLSGFPRAFPVESLLPQGHRDAVWLCVEK